MDSTTYHVFREPKTFEEFEAILKLRLKNFMEKGETATFEQSGFEDGLDVNNYDLCSVHYGLYEKTEAGEEELIGTVRFIDANKNPKSEKWMVRLLEKYPALNREVLKMPDVTLMVSITQKTPMARVADLIKKHRSNGTKLWEVSRLTLIPASRSFKMAVSFIETCYAFTIQNNDAFVCGIDTLHRKMYQSLFCYPLTLCGELNYGITEKTILYGDSNCLHPNKKPKIEQMATALRETGQVVFHPDWPDYMEPK